VAISTDYDFVIDVAPELSGESETRINRFIGLAKLSVSEDVWGAKADFATALLAAHYLTMATREGVGGEVKRKRIGEAEIEYGLTGGGSTSTDAVHELNLTSYGKQFLQLRRTLVITPRVSGCPL